MTKKTERGANKATSQSNDNKSKRITQEDIVLNHLRKYGTITSFDAFEKYRITRLAVSIHSLRKKGYNIDTYNVLSSNGRRYGLYELKEGIA